MAAPVLLPDGSWSYLLRWRTDVIAAADGTERRASTLSLPRAYISGEMVLSDSGARSLTAHLTSSPGSAVTIPLAHEATVTSGAFSGATVAMDGTYCDWITSGRTVLVVGAGASYTTTVVSHAAGVLTLAAGPSSGSYPAGATHVYPCESVLLEDAQQVRRYPVGMSRWQVTGRVATVRAVGGAGGAAVTTHDSLPVLTARPVSTGLDAEGWASGVLWADAGGGVASATWQTHGLRTRSGTWLIRTPAERQGWKVFLAAVRGRWKSFLAPTWRPDVTIYDQPAAGAVSIHVVEAISDLGHITLAGRVQLEFADGSFGYYTITGAPSDAGAYRVLSLASALPTPIPGGSVSTVSALERVRMASDDATLDYGGSWVGRLTLGMVAIEPVA